MSDLLADLKADHHAYLIESGNLIRNPRPVEIWIGGAYLAHISHRSCACGSFARILDRISHVEVSSLGAKRFQTLDITRPLQFPSGSCSVEITTLRMRTCIECLPLNFTPKA